MRLPIAAALLAALAGPAAAQSAPDGQKLFMRTCVTCHFARLDPQRMAQMAAPPMDMLSAHVRAAVGPDRDKFVAWIVDWVRAPSAQKSVEPMAIERFGLMPPIGESFPELTDAELTAIGEYIYDTYKDVQLPPQEQRRRLIEQTR